MNIFTNTNLKYLYKHHIQRHLQHHFETSLQHQSETPLQTPVIEFKALTSLTYAPYAI